MMKRTMVLLSGGLDSSVLLMKLKQAQDVSAIFIDRGQSNREAEQAAAIRVAEHAGCHLETINLSAWWAPLNGKIEMIDVPRNPIFALLASPFAMIGGCDEIAIGSNLDDAKTGDSNAGFVASFNGMVEAMGLRRMPQIVAPFLDLGWHKTDVANWGLQNLGEEFIAMTHSCWRSNTPCGGCAACIARMRALRDSEPKIRLDNR